MRKSSLKKKVAKSFVGRVLRRLLGEEKGTVMMEYIVVGLLIAAACVLAVAFFGNTITGMFASLAHSVAGDPNTADQVQNAVNAAATQDFGTAKTYNDNKHSGTAQNGNATGTQTTF